MVRPRFSKAAAPTKPDMCNRRLQQLIAIRGSNGPFGSIYHLNAIQSWGVSETGDVTNVHA